MDANQLNELADGATLIAQERQRQRFVGGYTDEHDDSEHDAGELARAGQAYEHCNVKFFPWAMQWWKPKDSLSNLVRAGALYQAEIDSLQRRLNRIVNRINKEANNGR